MCLDARWYKDHDFASNLQPFYRDRIVELHFFVLAMYFEPKFSSARIMLTKFFKVLTILDDTCDRYASLPEAKSLVNSLERYISYNSSYKNGVDVVVDNHDNHMQMGFG